MRFEFDFYQSRELLKPFILSLSKDERTHRSWFDKLTMSGYGLTMSG
jgi:hypothetical protein